MAPDSSQCEEKSYIRAVDPLTGKSVSSRSQLRNFCSVNFTSRFYVLSAAFRCNEMTWCLSKNLPILQQSPVRHKSIYNSVNKRLAKRKRKKKGGNLITRRMVRCCHHRVWMSARRPALRRRVNCWITECNHRNHASPKKWVVGAGSWQRQHPGAGGTIHGPRSLWL